MGLRGRRNGESGGESEVMLESKREREFEIWESVEREVRERVMEVKEEEGLFGGREE